MIQLSVLHIVQAAAAATAVVAAVVVDQLQAGEVVDPSPPAAWMREH